MDESTALAYLAGFIDGEGSIAVGVNKNPKGERRWYLRFSVHQLNPLPLYMLSQRFGGSVRQHGYEKRRHRQIFEWVTTAEMAYNAIKELRPLLIVKADEADVAIQFQESLKRGHGSRTKLTEDEKIIREDFYQRLRVLKQRLYGKDGAE